jgi:2-methylcitrate dehydratase PrpD
MSISRQSHGQELLAFAHGMSLNDLPSDVVDRAKACLLDALGCGLFGSGQTWSRILADEMVADASAGQSTVIGRLEPLSAPAAALCNGTAIHGFELDDLIAESIIHPAACVISSAIAAAESVGAPGTRLLEAIIAGYEVMHRVGVALGVEPAKRGFHTTSLVAPIACAVAACKVMDLTFDQLRSAVGLSCSAASGIKSFAAGHGGGMVKRLHLGRSAEAGVRMAQLASRGFLGPPFGIDSRFGLMEVFGGAGAQREKMSQNIGESWAMRDVWFKVYPICGWIQSVVQLLVQLRTMWPLTAVDVKSLQVGVSRYAAQNNGEPAPVDTMGAQYSIPYCAAVALTGDPRDPVWFQPDAVKEPATLKLASKVEIVVNPAIEAVYPAQFGASVKLELMDGSVFERMVLDCHGTPSDPCSGQEQLDKFRLLAGTRLSVDAVSELARLVDTVATLPSVRDLTSPLRAGPAALIYDRKKA